MPKKTSSPFHSSTPTKRESCIYSKHQWMYLKGMPPDELIKWWDLKDILPQILLTKSFVQQDGNVAVFTPMRQCFSFLRPEQGYC